MPEIRCGPEASVFNVLVTVLGIALMPRLYPQARYPGLAPKMDPPPVETLTSQPQTPAAPPAAF